MPKVGMEPIRRKELIAAAIDEIHAHGSLDVTVGQIARRAGVSSGLAHHYFGNKDGLLVATMRYLLKGLSRRVAERLRDADDPRARLSGVIAGNFTPEQFRPEVISAWLAFYVHAQASDEAHQLLRIYAHRLNSNLLDAYARLLPRADAAVAAEGTAAMIDGVWLRRALREGPADAASAAALVEDYVETRLIAAGAPPKGH
ncbi:transcriptional regulator BetI [Rhodobium gokarnense]|uniref:HTH-type transcriptional regulator BetI n=1 Tax=Rhodobium gokarnense TaxID=364296 RepID=A0ABT3HIC4_9HYPH|nr:transcriptional regulator BetI [Rhodobium gokarnense]MCW2310142.1 TetR/AcrR family transcriptional repressor of bet genes [Rhodobium gokarnense]